jgi:uncharacterized membrane protein required for colicin V production
VESIKPIDLFVLLALAGMFVIGYLQGVPRRLFGIAAMIFSILVALQLRSPFGAYLASEWTTITPAYSYMVAFGAIFVATAAALSIGIELTYQSAPLIKRWPVADEIVGGILGVVEGFVILVATFLTLDPYFSAATTPGNGEFGPLRFLATALDGSLTAGIVRDWFVPWFIFGFGLLVPDDIKKAFASILVALR